MGVLAEEENFEVQVAGQLTKLNDAINQNNNEEFEEALAWLHEHNQIAAISKHGDGNGHTPLFNAVSRPQDHDWDNTVDIEYHELMKLPMKENEYSNYKDIPFKYHSLFKALNMDVEPRPNDNVSIPYRTYFTWRLLSFSAINPNIYTNTNNKLFPLHHVVIKGYQSCFFLLLCRPDLNVDVVGAKNETPLHCAAYHQRNGMLETLIQRGCNVNAKTHYNIFGNYQPSTALDIAIRRQYPLTAELLFKYGAGIGAELGQAWSFQNLVALGCNINKIALFFATINNGNPIGNDGLNGIFKQCAISVPWEETARIKEDGQVEQYKPTYPFLECYEHLQKRCLELIDQYPDREEFKKLATYFGAYIPTQEVIVGKKTHDENGKKLETPEDITVNSPGTLKSLAALALANAKDNERVAAINHFIEGREKLRITLEEQAKKKKEKKALPRTLPTTALALDHVNSVFIDHVEKYNMQNHQDLNHLRQILKSFDTQLQNMSNMGFFTTYNNHYVHNLTTLGKYMLIWDGICGGGATFLTFIVAFIILAATTMPIFPALACAAFIAFLSVGISTLAVALTAVIIMITPLIVDAIKHSVYSIRILKSLRELADLVSLIPELMGKGTRALFAEIIDNGLSKFRLRAFIDGYRAEIADKLNHNDLAFIQETPVVPQDATNWQFYPARRRNNIGIEEEIDHEKENRELGLFKDMEFS